MMYLLTAPTVGMPKWVDTLRMHKQEITIQRLARQEEIFEAQECTEFEAMLYISTASLAVSLESRLDGSLHVSPLPLVT